MSLTRVLARVAALAVLVVGHSAFAATWIHAGNIIDGKVFKSP